MMSHRILVVDDSAMTRRVIHKTLALAGLEIGEFHEARDGAEALELLNKHVVDLIFTDLNMPNMAGDELLARIRENDSWNNVRVVVISTEGSQTRLAAIKSQGAAAILRKPFTPEQVKSVIEQILEPSL
jgi:two-component system chemotaxis response regulator CheY